MVLPQWSDSNARQAQLEDQVAATRTAAFGFRELSESRKVDAVMNHFDQVAPNYDWMNDLLSLGIQNVWKRAAIRSLGIQSGDRVLDVCGGTADLALLAARRFGSTGSAVVYDLNRSMIEAGRPKVAGTPVGHRIGFIQGDAEAISFPDNYFDVAMVGFGIRNLTHLDRGFAEMHRVLKPGGRFLCLEFSKPVNTLFRWVYDAYSFHLMPLLGQLLVGNRQGYVCLPETIRLFPLADELAEILRSVGFRHVRYSRMTNGIAVAHFGRKR